MNFLAHHAVALQIAPHAKPEFFVGNVLPDLVSTSGTGRLRDRHVAGIAAPDALVQGIRLHLAADRHFHGLPAFALACAEAKAALLAVPFGTPPTRVFFLAHAAVEIALDGLLLAESSAIADDFFARFEAVDLSDVAEETRLLLGAPEPLPRLERTLRGFAEHRYLYHYETAAGRAEALHRLSLRAGLSGFQADDLPRLGAFFDAFGPILQSYRKALLLPPPAWSS